MNCQAYCCCCCCVVVGGGGAVAVVAAVFCAAVAVTVATAAVASLSLLVLLLLLLLLLSLLSLFCFLLSLHHCKHKAATAAGNAHATADVALLEQCLTSVCPQPLLQVICCTQSGMSQHFYYHFDPKTADRAKLLTLSYCHFIRKPLSLSLLLLLSLSLLSPYREEEFSRAVTQHM